MGINPAIRYTYGGKQMATKYKKRFGDRKDGRRVRTLHPMDYVSPYIMVERNDASNFFRDSFEVTKAEEFIKRMRDNGLKDFGYTHLLIATYVRTVSQFPGINRFIGGQKIYARDEIVVNMMVKKKMATNEQGTAIKVKFDPADTVADVYHKFQSAVDEVYTSDGSGFDKAAAVINKIPGLIKKFIVWLLKTLDYFDLLPKALTGVSPFHGSLFITSMGSLGIMPIYHHLYNFGNVPVFIAFGAKRKAYELSRTGEVLKSLYIDLAVVTDERICDGFYFASAFRKFGYYMKHPEVLENAPETVVEDIK